MDNRKKAILSTIVKEYAEKAMPVSSSALVEKYDFDLSPATIRNEMLELEKEGFIYQPHISAGRVPTDKGYRFFVNNLMRKRQVTRNERYYVDQELHRLEQEYNKSIRIIAKLLSLMTNSLAITSFPDRREAHNFGISELLKEPEFEKTNEMRKIAAICDCLDENIEQFYEKVNKKELQVYIGDENPMAKTNSCSVIVSSFSLPRGERGVIALIGPKRMKYARNISLVDYLTKILMGGGSAFLIFISTDLYIK